MLKEKIMSTLSSMGPSVTCDLEKFVQIKNIQNHTVVESLDELE